MTQLIRTLTRRVPVVLVPLLSLLVTSACSSSDDGAEGSADGTGAAASTGGVTGVGGVATGGAPTGSGGAATGGAATGGANTGGAPTGIGGSATGGIDGAGGTTAGTGGDGTGGTQSADPVFHIFMLMGQSNMAGVAPHQPSDMNTDERLKVWGGCGQTAGQWNTAKPPLNDCPGQKGWNLNNVVDPGTWFGKTLLDALPEGHTIGLVGTAESGESINTFISGGAHHQMILNKIAAVKTAENARLSGIIFHQGESDNGQQAWPGKVVQLYNEVKAAWGIDYDVPFILGELPNGGCCSGHNVRVHEAADLLPEGYWVTQSGTSVMDQYHFDHASTVLMGKRYGEKMIEALGW